MVNLGDAWIMSAHFYIDKVKQKIRNYEFAIITKSGGARI